MFDYEAENRDELTFRNRDQLTVLRKGDEHEVEWWWARKAGSEGYIPRNLLGVSECSEPFDLQERIIPHLQKTTIKAWDTETNNLNNRERWEYKCGRTQPCNLKG